MSGLRFLKCGLTGGLGDDHQQAAKLRSGGWGLDVVCVVFILFQLFVAQSSVYYHFQLVYQQLNKRANLYYAFSMQ